MIKKIWFIFGLAVVIVMIITAIKFSSKNDSTTNAGYNLQTIKIENGWGYEILLGEKVFISQQNVPAIAGNHLFSTENDAKKVGELVLLKLQHKNSPTITKDDLAKLKINWK